MSNTPKAAKTALSVKQKERLGFILRCLIVFLVPLITGIVIFKKKGISPFGEQDLLSIDLWGQYFPMYRKFGLDHGYAEAMYNWSGALGFNNWVQNAFYTRSIFLIPFGLVPFEHSITYIDIVCLLRFGLGALACQLFFEYKFKSKNPLLMAISIGYGLCAYSTAFIMQFMWTDGLFLAPLVLIGLEKLINGKSPLMYVLMLAFTIYTNFYTGFGVCLFTGFYFASQWFSRDYFGNDGKVLRGLPDLKARGKLLGRFFLYSGLGGISTAFVLLPTVKGLGLAESANEGKLDFTQWYHTMAENAASMLPETKASLEFGVANIALGLFAFVLLPLYFMNSEIKFKEKVFTGIFLGILYAGLNYNPMDWVFNGFHFPNQLPGRWSFLFSFAIAIVAANGIARSKTIQPGNIISSLVMGMFFIGYAKYGNLEPSRTEKLSHWTALISIFAAAMVVWQTFVFLAEKNKKKAVKAAEETDAENKEKTSSAVPKLERKALVYRVCAFTASILIAAMAAGEVCSNAVKVAGAEDGGIPTSEMESYIKVSDVLYEAGQKFTNGNDDFYRMEANDGWTFNTSMIGDFNGIGYYGSTLNYGVYQLMRDMGNRVYANNVSTIYNTTSLFQNSLFGVRYIIDRGKYFGGKTGKGYNLVEDAEKYYVWENPTALPIAFGASDKILGFKVDPEEIRPVSTQNEMLNSIWGQDINVFEHIDPANFTYENSEFGISNNWNDNYFYRSDDTMPVRFVWTYKVPSEDPVYIEQNFRAGSLVINGTDSVDVGAERFRCLGSYPAGTELQIEYTASDVNIGCFGLDFYSFNMSKWNEVYNTLSASSLDVTSFKNTKITGTLNAAKSQMIFTTIPQDGGWNVYVDGSKVENFKALGTLMAFTVDAGEHEIVFKYHCPALAAGIMITLAALAITALCWMIWRRGGIKVKKAETPGKSDAEEKTEDEKSEEKSEDESEEQTGEEKSEPEKTEETQPEKKSKNKK